MNDISSTANIEETIKKAQKVYADLGESFIKQNNGKFIAVEVNSGAYFIGETKEEAVKNANKKYPGKVVFIRRIGMIEKVAAHSPLEFNKNYYARIF